MYVVLSGLCAAWSKRSDEYVAPACWIKSTLPYTAFSDNLLPFELLFGRKPQTTFNTLFPYIKNTGLGVGLDANIEERRKIFRVVRQALEKRHRDKLASRQKVNVKIQGLPQVYQLDLGA